MKFLNAIYGRLCATWGLIMFAITLLLFLIPFLMFSYFRKDPGKSYSFWRMSKVWIAVYLTSIACPLRVKGKKNFKPGETYIVTCNHNAVLDILISSPYVPGPNKTIAKIELSRIPLFGLVYKAGSILVDRKNDLSRRESFNSMKEVLKMGLHMVIYPEGTRNKSKEPLKSFHDGAFKLAIDTGKSIVPAVILNTRKAVPFDKPFFLSPRPLSMHFLEPEPVLPEDTVPILKDRVYQKMKTYYAANQR